MTQLVAWLNLVASSCGAVLLAPIALMPGWLSATVVAAITGVLMLLIFKYTSNQSAIRRVRAKIKANLLALSLFKDSVWVSLRCQGRILVGALQLLGLAVVPMLVMTIPMCLLLGQLSLWYQARPLLVGEEGVVTVHLAGLPGDELPDAKLVDSPAVQTTVGPVRVPSQQLMCWNLRAIQPGQYRLAFEIDGQTVEKELAIGDGLMRVSIQRPPWDWTEALLHPGEPPFPANSAVQAIEIQYPDRPSWIYGSNWWIVYWFAASMVFALLARPLLNVNI